MDIQIITRGTRSLGYCFITYSTEAEAQKAVQTLNKRVIAGREINVEVAKPQEELTATREAKAAARKEKLAAKKKAAAEAKAAAGGNVDSAAPGATDAAGEPKKKSKSRKPRGRRARADDGEEAENAEAVASGTDAEASGAAAGSGKKRSNRKKNSPSKAALANGEVDLADGSKPTGKSVTKPRGPKGAPEGELSKTLVFAANLSFDVDDELLKKAFEGLNVTSAHVVRRRFGARKSKGFGFVDFASEQDQQKALAQYNGKDYLGRPLTLKVAVQGSKEQAEAAAGDEAQVATGSSNPAA